MPDITPEEQAAFEEWRKGRATRKVSSTAKRKALTDLRSKYFREYSDMVVKYGGKKPSPKA